MSPATHQPPGAAGDIPGPQRLRAEAVAKLSPGTSRADRRRLAEEGAREQASRSALWKAWWFLPLVAAIAAFGYLGWDNAQDAPPPAPQVSQVPDRP